MTYEEEMRRINERAKKKYRKLKAQGICTQCGKAPALNGVMCDECARKHAEYARTQRQIRFDNGLCIRCGGLNKSKFNMCFDCRFKESEYRKDLRLRRKGVTT